MLENKIRLSILGLWLVTISGMIGIYLGNGDWFLPKTPLNLLLGAGLLLWNFPPKNGLKSILLWALTFFIGMLAETLGVKFGWIFGGFYTYGSNFGSKIFDVPWMIGVNWVLLTFSTGYMARSLCWGGQSNLKPPDPLEGECIASNLSKSPSFFLNILRKLSNIFSSSLRFTPPLEGRGAVKFAPFLAALLMVSLDFFIEPLAPQFGFWSWQLGYAPFQNFVAWFFIALGLQFLVKNEIPDAKSRVPFHHFLSQLVFFAFFYVCYCL
jgi:bisanhydrobacterioruberin hydratase